MSYDMLTFTQDSVDADVQIFGTLTGLNVSSAHVYVT